MTLDGNQHTCSFADDNNAELQAFNANTMENAGGDRIGLVCSFTELAVDYFLAISLQ